MEANESKEDIDVFERERNCATCGILMEFSDATLNCQKCGKTSHWGCTSDKGKASGVYCLKCDPPPPPMTVTCDTCGNSSMSDSPIGNCGLCGKAIHVNCAIPSSMHCEAVDDIICHKCVKGELEETCLRCQKLIANSKDALKCIVCHKSCHITASCYGSLALEMKYKTQFVCRGCDAPHLQFFHCPLPGCTFSVEMIPTKWDFSVQTIYSHLPKIYSVFSSKTDIYISVKTV